MTSDPPHAAAPIVVFDLGGVLIDWNPRYMYRALFDDHDAMERFLATVCTHDWNVRQDAGRPFAEAIAEATARAPEHAAAIEAFWTRWPEMMRGPVPGTPDVLRDLVATGQPVYALTNWSDETFPFALERFDFLGLFEGVVVSGRERCVKPDRTIYDILAQRFDLNPARLVFIDDSPANVQGALDAGWRDAHRFTDAARLRAWLVGLGALPGAA